MVGFSDPDANGAIVRGTSATAIERSKVQWYEPCDGFAGGTGAGSFAVPWMTWGRGGRIDCLPLAWKAATLIAPGTSLAKAFRTTFLETVDDGLLMAGKLEESFVEKARFEAAERQVF